MERAVLQLEPESESSTSRNVCRQCGMYALILVACQAAQPVGDRNDHLSFVRHDSSETTCALLVPLLP